MTRLGYVGTTKAGNWQDRIVARGLGNRAATTVRLFDNGVPRTATGAKGGEQS